MPACPPGYDVFAQHNGGGEVVRLQGCGITEQTSRRAESVAVQAGVLRAQQKRQNGGRARAQTVTRHHKFVVARISRRLSLKAALQQLLVQQLALNVLRRLHHALSDKCTLFLGIHFLTFIKTSELPQSNGPHTSKSSTKTHGSCRCINCAPSAAFIQLYFLAGAPDRNDKKVT